MIAVINKSNIDKYLTLICLASILTLIFIWLWNNIPKNPPIKDCCVYKISSAVKKVADCTMHRRN
jgi:hypothetical protein